MGTPVHTPPHHTSSSMADVSDSRLADAYAAVRSDSDPTTWAVAGYDKDAKDKIVLIAWTGPKAGILRKAKVSVHKANMKQVFRDFAVETQFSEHDDIDQQKLIQTVVKAGGANYMGQSSH